MKNLHWKLTRFASSTKAMVIWWTSKWLVIMKLRFWKILGKGFGLITCFRDSLSLFKDFDDDQWWRCGNDDVDVDDTGNSDGDDDGNGDDGDDGEIPIVLPTVDSPPLTWPLLTLQIANPTFFYTFNFKKATLLLTLTLTFSLTFFNSYFSSNIRSIRNWDKSRSMNVK